MEINRRKLRNIVLKTSIIFLLPIILVFNIFGQKQISRISQNKVQVKPQIAKSWKLVDLENFSFMLPKSMADKKARGIDSQVWNFENEEMELWIDSGMYTNDFQDLKRSYEVKEENIQIDGKSVRLFSWDINKDISGTYEVNKDGTIKPHETYEKHFSTGVYFQRGKRKYAGTNFVTTTKALESQEIAKEILKSIKFKRK